MSFQTVAVESLLALSVWSMLGTGRLTLAGPGFMACGAYVAFLIGQHAHAYAWICIIAGGAVAAVVGAVVDRCVNKLAAAPYTIATLTFALVVPAFASAAHVARGPVHPIGNIFYAIACLIVGLIAVAFARDHLRFAAGAAAAGLAGALYWSLGGALDSSAFALDRVGVMVAIALIAGAGNSLAVVLSALGLAVLARVAAPLTDQALIVDGVALIVALVYLPAGICPWLMTWWRAIVRSKKRPADGAA